MAREIHIHSTKYPGVVAIVDDEEGPGLAAGYSKRPRGLEEPPQVSPLVPELEEAGTPSQGRLPERLVAPARDDLIRNDAEGVGGVPRERHGPRRRPA